MGGRSPHFVSATPLPATICRDFAISLAFQAACSRPTALPPAHTLRHARLVGGLGRIQPEEKHMATRDDLPRTVLPMASKPRTGLITYDAKDPDTKYPPIEQLRPPKGAPKDRK